MKYSEFKTMINQLSWWALTDDTFGQRTMELAINSAQHHIFNLASNISNSKRWYFSHTEVMFDLSTETYEKEEIFWTIYKKYKFEPETWKYMKNIYKVLYMRDWTSCVGIVWIMDLSDQTYSNRWDVHYQRLSEKCLCIYAKEPVEEKLIISYLRYPWSFSDTGDVDCPSHLLWALQMMTLFFILPFYLSEWRTIANEHYNQAFSFILETMKSEQVFSMTQIINDN